jgi:hypothetical protein
MIEVSFTEVALFCWAVLATGYAFKWHQQFKNASHLVVLMVEHPEVRDQIAKAKDEFMKEHGHAKHP